MGACHCCYKGFVFRPPNFDPGKGYGVNLHRANGKLVHIPLLNEEGTIPAFWVPAKAATPKKGTFLYSHANACDIASSYDFMMLLHHNVPGMNVLSFEYIGYGQAKAVGDPTEDGCFESARSAIRYLILEKKCTYSDIVLVGTSLGCSPALKMAAEFPDVLGVMLEAPFLTCLRVVFEHIPDLCLGPVDMFRNKNYVSDLQCPVFLLHGTLDVVVPVNHSQALWEALERPSQWHFEVVEDAHHEDCIRIMGPRKYIHRVQQFLSHCHKRRRNSSHHISGIPAVASGDSLELRRQ